MEKGSSMELEFKYEVYLREFAKEVEKQFPNILKYSDASKYLLKLAISFGVVKTATAWEKSLLEAEKSIEERKKNDNR